MKKNYHQANEKKSHKMCIFQSLKLVQLNRHSLHEKESTLYYKNKNSYVKVLYNSTLYIKTYMSCWKKKAYTVMHSIDV